MGYCRRSDTLSLSKTVSLVPSTGDDDIACERWSSGAGTLVYGIFAGRGAVRHLQGVDSTPVVPLGQLVRDGGVGSSTRLFRRVGAT